MKERGIGMDKKMREINGERKMEGVDEERETLEVKEKKSVGGKIYIRSERSEVGVEKRTFELSRMAVDDVGFIKNLFESFIFFFFKSALSNFFFFK